MGIYIFHCKLLNGKWMKIGHHKVTADRPNAYYRVLRRGFATCMSPDEIAGKVDPAELVFLYWFGNMNSRDEARVHAILKAKFVNVGEWYLYSDRRDIVKEIIDAGGIKQKVTRLSVAEVRALNIPPDKRGKSRRRKKLAKK
jgi:hypothetical protein